MDGNQKIIVEEDDDTPELEHEEITHTICWSCNGSGKRNCGCDCSVCTGTGYIQIGGFRL
jgi:hypothetical protein